MRRILTLASAVALTAVLGISSAQAGGRGGAPQIAGSGNPTFIAGNVHINQNGDGCRNRCIGSETFNAGWNNGHVNVNQHGLKNGFINGNGVGIINKLVP